MSAGDVQRFNVYGGTDHFCVCKPAPDGTFIYASDFDALRVKHDALLSALRKIHRECEQVYDGAPDSKWPMSVLAEILQITGPLVGEKP